MSTKITFTSADVKRGQVETGKRNTYEFQTASQYNRLVSRISCAGALLVIAIVVFIVTRF